MKFRRASLALALIGLNAACAADDAPLVQALPEPALAAATSPAEPAVAPDNRIEDHAYPAWTALLRKHVKENGVDYVGLRADREQLYALLAILASIAPGDLAQWSEDERFAYWINVYNAFCIQLVVDNYPLDSIKDLGGKLLGRVWDKRFIPMNAHHPEGKDEPLSLNDVEHVILRVRFPDARVHAAINCASESCPPLRPEAFRAETLEHQLDEQMREFIRDPSRNTLNPKAQRASLSALFDWFDEDFIRDAGSVSAYVARYAAEPVEWLQSAKLSYRDYSWALNDASAPND